MLRSIDNFRIIPDIKVCHAKLIGKAQGPITREELQNIRIMIEERFNSMNNYNQIITAPSSEDDNPYNPYVPSAGYSFIVVSPQETTMGRSDISFFQDIAEGYRRVDFKCKVIFILNNKDLTLSCTIPLKLGHDLMSDSIFYWLYKNKVYIDKEGLSPESILALINAKESKIQRKIGFLIGQEDKATSRRFIPDDVKIVVWKRDGGRCVKCGSNENLEFDHIIPVAMGGSSTARNLQLLCEGCNREKGADLK